MESELVDNVEWQVDSPQMALPKRPRKTKSGHEKVAWCPQDIVSAAKLLHTSVPNETPVLFKDEQEMRRIFSLLYDVFRYKIILREALDETGFAKKFSQYKNMWPVVWLLFYDLYKRRFLPREHADQAVCDEAFLPLGLIPVEEALWTYKVRLAAALSRNRVAHRALHLDDLLPPHLRDERLLAVDVAASSAWANSFRISREEVMKGLSAVGVDVELDHVCPKVILIPAKARALVAACSLITSGKLVLQDRAFCLSAAYMDRLVTEVGLRGTVAQSHVISPRATGYLANIFKDNKNIDQLVAFGAGPRQKEYEDYLFHLGVTNCIVVAERFSSFYGESPLLQNVVAVLASPPTSWTGVADPVDLVCSRSGDMAMLRVLTQARRGRDILLLEQQRDTLRFAMSLPQVQLLLYESHSTSGEENLPMVQGAVNCMNEWARQKHTEEQTLQHLQEEAAEEKSSKSFMPGGTPAERQQREREAQEAALEAQSQPFQVQVPNCDLFEIVPLPQLCDHGQQCAQEDGCFLARVQRMEIIGLDAKYMIKIAEARGLFGTEPGIKKASTARTPRKKEQPRKESSQLPNTRRRTINLARLSEHTHASLTRATISDILPCERYSQHVAGSWKRRGALARLWWQETMRAVRRLLPLRRLTPRSRAAATPVPPLRLPRANQRKPLPLHTILLPNELRSQFNDILPKAEEIRRNSC